MYQIKRPPDLVAKCLIVRGRLRATGMLREGDMNCNNLNRAAILAFGIWESQPRRP
jgi:hypothetical protein